MDKKEISDLQKAIGLAAQKQMEDQIEKEIEIKVRIISAAYDRATAYTNLLIFAGYAGTFTLWSFTREFLPEFTTVFIATMVGISLFVFCGWEIYKMIYTSADLRALSDIMLKGLSPEKFMQEMKAVEIKAKKDTIRLYQYWRLILLITVPLGFGGALLMFYNFMANMTGLPYWPS